MTKRKIDRARAAALAALFLGPSAGAALAAGQSAELTWTFEKLDALEFACNLPGHYQAGMVGPIEVSD
jgi:uncharacterized cupredoxin-like copper-binding protein